jgi:ribosomal protein S1
MANNIHIINKTFEGKITNITNFGIFIQTYFFEGLLHKNQLHGSTLDDWKIGDSITVKVLNHNNDYSRIPFTDQLF